MRCGASARRSADWLARRCAVARAARLFLRGRGAARPEGRCLVGSSRISSLTRTRGEEGEKLDGARRRTTSQWRRRSDVRAFAEAAAAAARGEVPIGAVIVRDGAIIARAGNRTLETARSDRACRNSGDSRGLPRARLAAARWLRSLCDAGALRHVRGGDLASRACGGSISRRPTRKAAASSTGRAFSRSRPAITRRKSMAESAKARRRSCCAGFLKGGGERS